jgi:hypothetical protein
MLSLVASMTPFSDFNQSPRNMYQCQMGKQTMGVPAMNIKYRSDNKMYRLIHGQVIEREMLFVCLFVVLTFVVLLLFVLTFVVLLFVCFNICLFVLTFVVVVSHCEDKRTCGLRNG